MYKSIEPLIIMPPRKTAASATASTSTAPTERLQLATAISKFTTAQDAYLKAAESLTDFKANMFIELDLQLESKRAELAALQVEFKQKLDESRINTELLLKEFKRDAACTILAETDEVPIAVSELKQLRESVESSGAKHIAELDALRADERKSAAASLAAAINNSDLKHKAEVAENTAAVKQQEKEIMSLTKMIANLQHELGEQRKLTKEVAEAGRQGAVTVNSGGRQS